MTALALALLVSLPAAFNAPVVAVHDGDTVSVLREGRALRVRLHGIDAPELGQAFGRPAKQLLSALVFKRQVHVVPVDTDRYGRLVARVFASSLDINLELVRRGLAWHFTRYSSDPALAAAEREARRRRLGLWRDKDPLPPWSWRRTAP